mmetsp:Transcript_41640/g.93961  ORF Transcript_41640/g.93961 Transcript_41640/m.93961 type:complete len:228 (-) Transcript_41640:157-840(-)
MGGERAGQTGRPAHGPGRADGPAQARRGLGRPQPAPHAVAGPPEPGHGEARRVQSAPPRRGHAGLRREPDPARLGGAQLHARGQRDRELLQPDAAVALRVRRLRGRREAQGGVRGGGAEAHLPRGGGRGFGADDPHAGARPHGRGRGGGGQGGGGLARRGLPNTRPGLSADRHARVPLVAEPPGGVPRHVPPRRGPRNGFLPRHAPRRRATTPKRGGGGRGGGGGAC